MNDRSTDWRCGILDLLEAAALRSTPVEVRIGKTWRRVTVRDVIGADGEDWLLMPDGDRVAVSDIDGARPIDED